MEKNITLITNVSYLDSELVVSVSELEGLPKCVPNSGLMDTEKLSILLMLKPSYLEVLEQQIEET